MYRPPRAHHCRICRRCIRRMDHHCPWINNCVGEWNQKYFLQFLFYVALLSAYSIFLVVTSWYFHGAEGEFRDRNGNFYPRSLFTFYIKLFPFFHNFSFPHILLGLQTREVIQMKQSRILHSVILVLESILFGMFVCAIACDQFDAIFSDETLVEQAKRQGPYRPKKPKMTLLAEVCGQNHTWKWFIPCYSMDRRILPKAGHQYTV